MDGDVRRFGLWPSNAESDPRPRSYGLQESGQDDLCLVIRVGPNNVLQYYRVHGSTCKGYAPNPTLIVIIARYSPAACGR